MPFTFAHPAIILPANKMKNSWICFTALVIESMVPDFEYFLRFTPYGIIGHTFIGFIYFNIPLTFIITFAWNNVIKEPLINSLPNELVKLFGETTYEKLKVRNFKELMVFMYSAIIGMATHVIWDGFTHKTGFFVNRIEFLRLGINIYKYEIPFYKFIQHGSTIIGIIVITLYLYKYRVKHYITLNRYSIKRKVLYWGNIINLTLIIYGYRVFFILKNISLKNYGTLIVSLISSFLLSLFYKKVSRSS